MLEFQIDDICFGLSDIGGGTLKKNISGHSHPSGVFELHFITNGKGTLITDNKSYSLKKGDFFVTGPFVYHEQLTSEREPIEDIFLTLRTKKEKANSLLISSFLSTHFFYTENFDFSMVSKILSEYREKRLGYKNTVRGLLTAAITDIARLYLPESIKEQNDIENLNDKRFIIIDSAFLFEKDITLPILSSKLGICERQTQRLLKKYYGKSFREKKNEMKNNQM